VLEHNEAVFGEVARGVENGFSEQVGMAVVSTSTVVMLITVRSDHLNGGK
jgi:hypothetical protein